MIESTLAAVLALVFLVAAVLKVRDLYATEVWIERLGLGVPAAAGARFAVLLEGTLAAVLLAVPSVGGWLSAATLIAMSGLLVRADRRGVGCACFGSQETSARGGLIRNAVLIVVSVVVALSGTTEGTWPFLVIVGISGVLAAVWPLEPQRRALEA